MRSVAVLACALLGASAAHALPAVQIDPSAFHFALAASNGIVSPGVAVGFDPQPDPPSEPLATLDLRDPTQAIFTTPTGGERGFRFLFALGSGGDLSPFELVLTNPPPEPDRLTIEARNRDGKALLTIDALVATSDGGPLDPASIVGFNPQPDPPGTQSIGVDFGFALPGTGIARGVSFATLRLEIHDDAGNAFTFTQVPEPATLMSVALGVALLAVRRGRR